MTQYVVSLGRSLSVSLCVAESWPFSEVERTMQKNDRSGDDSQRDSVSDFYPLTLQYRQKPGISKGFHPTKTQFSLRSLLCVMCKVTFHLGLYPFRISIMTDFMLYFECEKLCFSFNCFLYPFNFVSSHLVVAVQTFQLSTQPTVAGIVIVQMLFLAQ